ncbi:MAG: ABC transporter permease [Elusimicrobia bacterium]|nr:ABC transporter permease [Elusimicrobiota bacterium]
MLLKIAWRNVWRNKRRSLLTLAASSFGLGLFIFLFAFSDGMHEQLIANATRTSLGHLQVYGRGYRADPVLERAIAKPAELRAALAGVRGLSLVLPRVESYGLASSASNSVGVMVVGVDPALEKRATRISNTMVKGLYLGRDSGTVGQILIGKALAKRLKLELGDKMVLLSQAADGSMANALFRVRGIYKTGAEAVDLGTAFITLGRAKEFLGLGQGLTSMLLFAGDLGEVDRIKGELGLRLEPKAYEALSWKDLDPSLLQTTELDDAINHVILLVVFMIVALGIVNTLLMSVFERTREFGVLLAMGMEPKSVVAMVSFEAAILASLSLAVGTSVGVILALHFGRHGIDLSRWTEGVSVSTAFLEPILYPKLRAYSVLKSCLSVFLVTIVSGLYPAFKASRLSPVKALRHS